MKACLTALFLGVACFLFQAGAAEPTEAERKLFLEAKAKADQGDADAQFNLGVMYAKGQGVVKDEVEAVKWFRKAADQGNAEAQSNLGVMYAKGEGVVKDEVEAVKWFRKAADQGDADAQYNLGVMYAKGQGVVKDEVEAVK
jgi:TPR repeat protein